MLSLKFKAGFLFKPKRDIAKANKYTILQGVGRQKGKDTKKPVQGFNFFFQITLNRVCAAKQVLKAAFEL